MANDNVIRIGLYIEDGAIQVKGDSGLKFEVHVFDKDTYDTTDDKEREEMDSELEIVEAMSEVIAEV